MKMILDDVFNVAKETNGVAIVSTNRAFSNIPESYAEIGDGYGLDNRIHVFMDQNDCSYCVAVGVPFRYEDREENEYLSTLYAEAIKIAELFKRPIFLTPLGLGYRGYKLEEVFEQVWNSREKAYALCMHNYELFNHYAYSFLYSMNEFEPTSDEKAIIFTNPCKELTKKQFDSITHGTEGIFDEEHDDLTDLLDGINESCELLKQLSKFKH